MKKFLANLKWRSKQKLAQPSRYYGDGGTIHRTNYVDVEMHNGEVVSVWFRCQPLEFKSIEVSDQRAAEMTRMGQGAPISGIEVLPTDV